MVRLASPSDGVVGVKAVDIRSFPNARVTWTSRFSVRRLPPPLNYRAPPAANSKRPSDADRSLRPSPTSTSPDDRFL